MVEFVDASILDLVKATEFLYYIKPSLKGKFVFGIEKAQPFDRSVVFHLRSLNKDSVENEDELFILSSEYILTHSFWNGTEYEKPSTN